MSNVLHLFDFCDILSPEEMDVVFEMSADEVLWELQALAHMETLLSTCDDTVLLIPPEIVTPFHGWSRHEVSPSHLTDLE